MLARMNSRPFWARWAVRPPTRIVRRAGAPLAPDAIVHLSVTHAVLHKSRRGLFDAYARTLYRDMAAQPGIVAYAIRRELFGTHVWTLTVWDSVDALEGFFRSPAHREAMVRCAPAIERVRSARHALARREVPPSWAQALSIVDGTAWSRR